MNTRLPVSRAQAQVLASGRKVRRAARPAPGPTPPASTSGRGPARLGVDLARCDRLAPLTRRRWFLTYMFADVEIAHAASLGESRRLEFLTGRFAAKEAVLKILGVGLFQKLAPRDIVIGRSGDAPVVALRGSAARAGRKARVAHIRLSLTHADGLVIAVAAGW